MTISTLTFYRPFVVEFAVCPPTREWDHEKYNTDTLLALIESAPGKFPEPRDPTSPAEYLMPDDLNTHPTRPELRIIHGAYSPPRWCMKFHVPETTTAEAIIDVMTTWFGERGWSVTSP